MFANFLPLFAFTAILFTSGSTPRSPALDADGPRVADSVHATGAASPELPEMLMTVSATLYITDVGYGYYYVGIDGQASAPNATVGVSVRGDDLWFDDYLFSMGYGYLRTDSAGRFNAGATVHRSVLDEDWEGRDEIYARVEVSGAGSTRTNTISRSF